MGTLALLGGLVVMLALPRLRRRRGASTITSAGRSPASSAHGSASVPAAAVLPRPEAEPASLAQLVCPACRRMFQGRARFCPLDGEELILVSPLEVIAARAANRLPHAMDKICPSCSRRYDTEATICRRDGAELVSVN